MIKEAITTTFQDLLAEMDTVETAALRRLQIGQLLAEMGDPRRGVGLKDGIPDIVWLPVTPGGQVTIIRHWQPESPEDEERFFSAGDFAVSPFYLAKYLVTSAQYQSFVVASDGYANSRWWQEMPPTYQHQPLAEPYTKLGNAARDTISWYQSVAFARWLNHQLMGLELPHPAGQGSLCVGDNAQVRLPREWEWQWAAQNGAEARPYPWGEYKPDYANTIESGLKQATAVGLFPQGAAACGALDMAGNLMEWCANDKANPEISDVASTASKVLRGGDWGYDLQNATCTYCDDELPHQVDALNGFRLVIAVK